MSIEAILFDLDDTLVVEVPSVESAFRATCERARDRHGIAPDALEESVRTHARRIWYASPVMAPCRALGMSSWEALWARFPGDDGDSTAFREWAAAYRREAWASALADHGVRDDRFAERLAATFQEERRARHHTFPDVDEVLPGLRESYRLGLVTNGVPSHQREKMEGAGLVSSFEAVVISGAAGVAKPDPRIFRLALAELAVPPGGAVMVGNSLGRDVAGARGAGIRAIWLNRSGGPRDGDVAPDGEIRSLRELREHLG